MTANELCRLCAADVAQDSSLELFANENLNLLRHIKSIVGIMLNNQKNLPKFICCTCYEHLQNAIQFRERCIKTQNYFTSAEFKHKIATTTTMPTLTETPTATTLVAGETQVNCIMESAFTIGTETSMFAKKQIDDAAQTINGLKQITANISDINAMTVAQENWKSVTIKTENDVTAKKKLLNKTASNIQIIKVKSKNKLNKTTAKQKQQHQQSEQRSEQQRQPQLFVCDQCGNHFNCRYHFQTHLKRHTGDKQFHCELCPCKFFTNSELNRHMRRHTGERPFACQYCNRRFTDYSTRRKHERTHTNERPFSCVHCNKAFTTSYVLKNHILTHTGERSFRCALCNKSFQRRTHLVVHNRSLMHKQNEQKSQKETSTTTTTTATKTGINSANGIKTETETEN